MQCPLPPPTFKFVAPSLQGWVSYRECRLIVLVTEAIVCGKTDVKERENREVSSAEQNAELEDHY